MAKTKKEKVTEPTVEKTVEETKQQEQPKEEKVQNLLKRAVLTWELRQTET